LIDVVTFYVCSADHYSDATVNYYRRLSVGRHAAAPAGGCVNVVLLENVYQCRV